MAIFGIVTRVKTKDGYYPTYIRVSQGNGQAQIFLLILYLKNTYLYATPVA